MLKKLLFALVFALVLPTAALAQKRTLPMPYFKHPVSKGELIRACKDNDRSVMNVTCEEYREDLNWALSVMGVKLELKDVDQLLEYLGNLSVEKLPTTQQIIMGRVMPDRTRELGAFDRTPTEGEMGLYDGTNGIYVLSLSCGNPFGTRVSVFLAKNPNDTDKSTFDQDALRRAAEDQAREDAKKARNAGGPGFFSPQRLTGKVFWYGAVPAAIIAGGYCAVTQKCFMNENTLRVTIR